MSLRIALFGWNSAKEYSGGRYHAWLVAEAFAALGHEVVFVTNHVPVFAADFESYPHHSRIRAVIGLDTPEAWPRGPFDIALVIPHREHAPDFFIRAEYFAVSRGARLATINFETPNWFNAAAPEKLDVRLWDAWRIMCRRAARVISISAEGDRHAREFFAGASPQPRFAFCHPCINSRAADSVPGVPRENRIVLVSRFSKYFRHKGGAHLEDMFCEAMRGYTLALLVGTEHLPEDELEGWRRAAAELGIAVEVKERVSDREKFAELKRAKLLLFPSFFEGFGLPPVEAQYCGTPCVAFDLPVLREVGGAGARFVPLRDWPAFRAQIAEALASPPDPAALQESIRPVASFESAMERWSALLATIMSSP